MTANIRKSIKRDDKLLQIVPKRPKAEKTKLLVNFVLDVVHRCTANINHAQALYAGDAAKVKNKLPH